MDNELKELNDLAMHCCQNFEIKDNYFQDGNIKSYEFGWQGFLDIKECLKYARHQKEIFDLNQYISGHNQQCEAYEGQISKLKKKISSLEESLIEEEEQRAKWEKRALEQEYNYGAEKFNKLYSENKGLKISLGHAKSKIKRLQNG